MPGFVAEGIAERAAPAEIDVPVPSGVRGLVTVRLQVAEGEKLATGVVEYAVHDDADAMLMAAVHERSERDVGSQPPVDEPEIAGIIAVRG